jgi:hypothetical protein
VEYFHHQDAATTEALLKSSSEETGGVSVWLTAYKLAATGITVSDAYQDVIGDEWYGLLDKKNSALKLCFYLFFPPVLWIWNPDWTPESTKSADDRGPGGWRAVWRKFCDAVSIRMDMRGMGGRDMDDDDEDSIGGGFFTWAGLARDRTLKFYEAPVTTFYFEVIAYVAFATLFSYCSLATSWTWLDVAESPSLFLPQIIMVVWYLLLIENEVEQSWNEGFSVWWGSMWNRWDFMVYLTILVSMLMLADDSASYRRLSKVFMGFAAMLIWGRMMRFFAFSATLGPKLHMVSEMVSDIAVFLALLILVLIGYGVAAIVIFEPYRQLDMNSVFVDIFYRPIFQAYGETFLDVIHEESDCLGAGFTSCSGNTYLYMLVMVVYLLVANILLVNLLIAMMSSTYERVNEQAYQIWSLQYTEMFEEFTDKFGVPPPFTFVINIFRLINMCRSKAHTQVQPGSEKGGQYPTEDRCLTDATETYSKRHTNHYAHFMEHEYMEQALSSIEKDEIGKLQAEQERQREILLRIVDTLDGIRTQVDRVNRDSRYSNTAAPRAQSIAGSSQSRVAPRPKKPKSKKGDKAAAFADSLGIAGATEEED